MNMLNIDNPMARPLSCAEEDAFWGSDDQAKAEQTNVDYVMHLVRHGVGERDVQEAMAWLDEEAGATRIARILIDAAGGKNVEVAARELIREAATEQARLTIDAGAEA